MSVYSNETKDQWQECWEKEIYSRGRHLNLYPHHSVVSYVYRNYPSRSLRKDIRVLEVGCGAGNNLWFAAREGMQVYGIDGSSSAVSFAEQRFLEDHLEGNFCVGDFSILPWAHSHFDLVIDRQSVLCNTKMVISKVFNEVKRVLRPGGRFFSMIYSQNHPEIVNGEHMGDNSYCNFQKGYFVDCGIVHFCDYQEVVELYGNQFLIKNIEHVMETKYTEDGLEVPLNAYWRIDCERES